MELKIALSAGLSILSLCIRYRWPTVHPRLASIGIAVGIEILASAIIPSDHKFWPTMTMVGGVLLFLVGVDWYFTASKKIPDQTNAKPSEASVTTEKKDAPTVNVTGSGNITTFGQVGDNTVNNTINQAPQPDLRTISNEKKDNPDGTTTFSVLFEIVSPYPPGQLYLAAHATDILEFNVVPQRSGIHMTGHSGKREAFSFTTIMNPFGQYLMTVKTQGRSNIQVEYNFQ